ncbi:MAG: hypothetical protein MG2_0364 [uncultured Candidatus Poseidoniales archaeon]|nr:MAG: hypothetical protein MG2_0364 [uncultured Candidatus Poseidoniales archaeon]
MLSVIKITAFSGPTPKTAFLADAQPFMNAPVTMRSSTTHVQV